MAAVSARGQERKDALVTLVSAKSAQLIERGGQSFRKVTGPARFLHNNTYLLCDSALWNVTTNIIDAVGHVQIIQDRTRLSSGSLQYVVDDDLAKFRGGLVQLEDKDKNTLRTRYLDYNTKDSVAIFQNGASMRDKDGQVIESLYGSYDSKASLFVFNDQVNMYMDTTFVKTSRLEYRSDINTAYFGYGTDMWQDDNMLSANDGWYDRDKELFFFRRNVHLLTKDQETWSDTLYYHRKPNNVEMNDPECLCPGGPGGIHRLACPREDDRHPGGNEHRRGQEDSQARYRLVRCRYDPVPRHQAASGGLPVEGRCRQAAQGPYGRSGDRIPPEGRGSGRQGGGGRREGEPECAGRPRPRPGRRAEQGRSREARFGRAGHPRRPGYAAGGHLRPQPRQPAPAARFPGHRAGGCSSGRPAG